MLPPELLTLRDVLRWAVSRFREAGLFFGHGSHDPYDEAAYLILHALHLPPGRLDPFLDARLTAGERDAVHAILARRLHERLPAAYITHEAWLGDFPFYVDERVIVPRSHIAELLLEDGLAPWIGDAGRVRRALDLCTGSGCLAILLAHAFPHARIDAVDISPAALEVAARNIADYALGQRIEARRGDLFAGLGARRYDVIIANPPYVTAASMRALPPETRHEPELALASGDDGLDAVRGILAGARRHLKSDGIVAVEVGGNRAIVEAAFPDIPFTWIESASGEGMVFLLQKEHLPGRG